MTEAVRDVVAAVERDPQLKAFVQGEVWQAVHMARTTSNPGATAVSLLAARLETRVRGWIERGVDRSVYGELASAFASRAVAAVAWAEVADALLRRLARKEVPR